MKSACMEIKMLARYIEGSLSDEERDQTEQHLSLCDRCRKEMVSAYDLMKDSDLSEWEPASDEQVRSVLNSLDVTGRFRKAYEWITSQLTAGMPQAEFQVREMHETLFAEYQEFTEDIDGLQTVFHIEKAGEDKINIRIRVLKDNLKAQNIRLIFTRQGSGSVSRPLKEDYAFFEELPFGLYRFTLKQHALEKGTCFINISESEIEVRDDLS